MRAFVIEPTETVWVSGNDTKKIQKIKPKCQVLFYLEDI